MTMSIARVLPESRPGRGLARVSVDHNTVKCAEFWRQNAVSVYLSVTVSRFSAPKAANVYS